MKKILRIKEFTGSLFMRLLLGFGIVILLLASSNLVSISFFRDSIREEIILYNTKNAANTAENYEEHIRLALNSAYTLFMNDAVESFNTELIHKDQVNYSLAVKVNQKIDDWLVSNQFLHIHNIFLYYSSPLIVLDQGGSASPETTFDRFYTSKEYPYAFWEREIASVQRNRILPAAEFSYNYPDLLSNKSLIPIVVKNRFFSNMHAIVMLDSQAAFKKLHDSINNQFYILDSENRPLFVSGETDFVLYPEKLTGKEGYYTQDEHYIFYNKSDSTGLTYVNIIPNQNINSKIFSLNMILLFPLLLSLVIALVSSVLFSRWFNNPVKKIIEGIQHLQDDHLRSGIKEFQWLHSSIHSILRTNKEFSSNIERNNNLLQKMSYVNQLRNIHPAVQDHLNFSNKPYCFILIDITFIQDMEEQHARAVHFIREVVEQHVKRHYDDSITMQIENNQILVLVFEASDSTAPSLEGVLGHLLKIIEMDSEELYVTVTISSKYSSSSEITTAYEETVQMLRQRKLDNKNQVFWTEESDPPVFILTPMQEQELQVHLTAGNETEVVKWAERQLLSLQKNGGYEFMYHKLLEYVMDKVERTLHAQQAPTENLLERDTRKKWLFTLEQYEEFMKEYLASAASAIKQKKDEQDHITSFVFDFIEHHYMEDISLDLVADKLRITGGYLSTYFKEKTGMNFSDYVNKLRIEKAKQFLQKPNLKVQDVAEKVGYNNAVSFIRVFKKMTGQTPGEYRKST